MGTKKRVHSPNSNLSCEGLYQFIMVQLFPEETRITLTRGLFNYKACFLRSIKSLIVWLVVELTNCKSVFWFILNLRFPLPGSFRFFGAYELPTYFTLRYFKLYEIFGSTYFRLPRTPSNLLNSLHFHPLARHFSEFYDSIRYENFHSNI